MARAVSHRPLPAEAPMRSLVSPRRICAGQSGTVTGFFSQYFYFPLSVSFHHSSTLIFIYMLLLPDEKTVKGWEPCIKQCYFGTRGALDIKQSHSFSPLKGSSQLTVSRKWRRGGTQIAKIAARHVLRTFHISLAPISSEHRFTETHLGTSRDFKDMLHIFFSLAVVKSCS
jgi:hypothetical protein